MKAGSKKPDDRQNKNPFDNQQFDSLFNEYYSPLCRFSMKYVFNKEVAEDIVQEFFVYLWEHWNRLSTIASIKSYAYTAVKNRSLNCLQKQFSFKKGIATSEMEETEVNSKLPDPQELLESKELEKILEKALEALPARCRTIFLMKRFEEFSNKEVAEKLKISEKTVEAQMTIAIRKITAFVSDRWGLVFLLLIEHLQKNF
jgi:RNA polymerase sigma-70 factor (ECF subfamily)